MANAKRRSFAHSGLLSPFQAAHVHSALAGEVPVSDLDVMERSAYDVAVIDAGLSVERRTVPRRQEDFMLLFHDRHARLVRSLCKGSRVPVAANELLALAFVLMREEDGEVLAPRATLRKRLGVSASTLQLALNDLVRLGALIRRREPEPGKQGRGTVRYFVNPKLATYLPPDERAHAQLSAPEVGNVVDLDGSRRPAERRARAPLAVMPAL